ncbi:flagellar hook-length control protein FliK [Stenotrophomonas sp. ZAC14D1_NAIMI4_6]|uniref:flagellar hook-length control protein FliK n=1 Tax=unclassified Stenotrophomonas maltophilia group TaxID=2961925 RepID=UPI000D5426D2|nr:MULTISPECIES: flagellar hook-length control protein FliK [unclassified Stenotrophomonas maltophilia group]AWH37108.1 flagellar hook-length control protein FliK [Stenotrophomonas sp. ZAC14D1_NAIMI4_6]AWH41298.1 flagellar hook-length control protein FliK [Stenotrophomonas sp. ZAC14D1_NAIMI4_1]
MPSALSSSTGTGSTPSTGSSSARSTGSGKEFGQMLQGSPETAAKAPPASKAQPGKAGAPSHGAPANPDGSADKPSSAATDSDTTPTEAATAASPPTSPAADDKDTASEGDDAPWPPLGLAGLVLAVPVPTDGVASTPAASATGVDAGLPAAAPTLPAAAPLAAGAPASPAATAAMADSDGEITTQQLPDMILGQQALDAADDADSLLIGDRTPPAPLQAPLPAALQDLKAALASTAAFNGEPTPTPTLGDDGFDQAIGARLGWLADQKIGHAHIRLNPEDLGPVDVRLQMNGDKVHASFSSPHVDVRQALESSLPRLRELLGEQGFQLAHADVGHQNSGDGSPSSSPGGGTGLGGGDGEPSRGEATMSAAQLIRQRGLLDAYA